MINHSHHLPISGIVLFNHLHRGNPFTGVRSLFKQTFINIDQNLWKDAENSDLFDVLEYVAFAVALIAREQRVAQAQSGIFEKLNAHEKEFLEFVLKQYIDTGVDELAVEKLSTLLTLKYFTITDAMRVLGDVEKIRSLFIGFQRHLYLPIAG